MLTSQSRSFAVYANPENYKKLHKIFVPLSDRIRFILYRGYYLCIKLKDIEEHCEQIDGE